MTHAAGAEKGTEKVSGGRRRGALREGEGKVLSVSARCSSPGCHRRPHTSQDSAERPPLPSFHCGHFFFFFYQYELILF